VYMGPTASISWNQVDNKPGDLAYLDDIPVLPRYIKSTYIDSTEIRSPKITGGTITGGLFRTAPQGHNRPELKGTGFKAYDAANQLHGIVLDSGNFSRIDFYFQDELRGVIQQAGGTFSIYPWKNASMALGISGKITRDFGDWDFIGASVLRALRIELGQGDGATHRTAKGELVKRVKGVELNYHRSMTEEVRQLILDDDGVRVNTPSYSGGRQLRNIIVTTGTPNINMGNVNDIIIQI